MDHLPRLILAFFLLLLLACTAVAAPSVTTHEVYLPLVSVQLEHGGPHLWPNPTITPTPTLEHGGFDPWPRATITPTPEVNP